MSGRVTFRHMAEIMVYLTNAKRSPVDVAERFGFAINGMRRMLREMHALRLVRIAGWTRCGAAPRPRPLYTRGAGNDCPPPPGMQSPPEAIKPTVQRITFAYIWRALEQGGTVMELSERTGSHRTAIYPLLMHMRELRLIEHDGEFRHRSTGMPRTRWRLVALGEGPAPRRSGEAVYIARYSKAARHMAAAAPLAGSFA